MSSHAASDGAVPASPTGAGRSAASAQRSQDAPPADSGRRLLYGRRTARPRARTAIGAASAQRLRRAEALDQARTMTVALNESAIQNMATEWDIEQIADGYRLDVRPAAWGSQLGGDPNRLLVRLYARARSAPSDVSLLVGVLIEEQSGYFSLFAAAETAEAYEREV